MKSHRGLSSIVGAVFLIAIVIGALSYLTYSLEIMGNFSESLIAEESRLKDKQREAFEVTSIDITAANKLDGVIKNTGQIPIKLSTLWIDEQGVNDVVQKFKIDTAIAPGNSFNLIDSVDYTMDPLKGYNMKLVSTRGEVQTFFVNSASQAPIKIQLIAIPETVPTEFTSTLLMTVVNNMTNNNVLKNLTPDTMNCGEGCTLVAGPTPTSYDTLNPGDIAIFQWVYKLTGEDNDSWSFTGKLLNGFPGNEDSVTVTVKTVVEAKIAGQSLNSLGIGAQNFSADVFIMHAETVGMPAASDYQLSLPKPDQTGTTILFADGIVKKFISANTTATDIFIPAGVWNASLTYNTARLPDGMAAAADDIWTDTKNGGHTFHFNNLQTSAIEDSGVDITCYALTSSGSGGVYGGLTNAANWYSTQGVNASGAYYFDGTGDYIRIENNDNDGQCNFPDTNLFSIAGWFNATQRDSYHTTQTILQEAKTQTEERYEVVIGDGTSGNHGVVFFTMEFKDNNETVTCKSDTPAGSSRYMDDEWHHFVAVRYADYKCKLYIDGVEKDDQSIIGTDNRLETDGLDLFIGSKGTIPKDEFQGMLDDIMIFITHPLSSTDVTALKGASFGEKATQMTFIIENATNTGTTVNNIVTTTNYDLPYVDQMHHTAVNDLWTGFNYTTGLLGAQTMKVATGNRINFTMSFDGGMDLNLRIDDLNMDGVGGTLLSSYLQPPNPPQDFPSYFVHDNDNKVNFYVFNAGDEGAWFTYQGTRIVFNGTGGHYAGIVYSVSDGTNTVLLTDGKDGPFIASGNNGELVFHEVRTDPSTVAPSTPDQIPVGNYDVTVFMNGYDDDGTLFVRSISLGSVFVIE